MEHLCDEMPRVIQHNEVTDLVIFEVDDLGFWKVTLYPNSTDHRITVTDIIFCPWCGVELGDTE